MGPPMGIDPPIGLPMAQPMKFGGDGITIMNRGPFEGMQCQYVCNSNNNANTATQSPTQTIQNGNGGIVPQNGASPQNCASPQNDASAQIDASLQNGTNI